MAEWTNSDGLVVRFEDPSAVAFAGRNGRDGKVQELVVDFTYDNLPTPASGDGRAARIPANSWIKSATLLATSDWGGSTPTLTIGLQQLDGTEIDNNGIDDAIAEAALDTGDVVACDGALVGAGTVADASNDGYIVATTGGTVTSGAATLIVEYITF